ncbi:branched-chain amino acid ABC transporter permease [Sphingomonas sp. BLCC-B65]|uniref:branched-chain amino acid ABC transporter permease n=1 Tax=uncultured Microbacterium sp. TaxID=191216 RepID=UPI0025ED232F|nr:branched-chain amino acid ABC transporter permease [uncultured Microbacterium sp.]MDC7802954.1 branched-chain amino acid ABC transporter permease [Sphingomonas sp. BLCC-B65]
MTVTTGVPTLVPGRTGAFIPFVVGAVLVVVMAVLPLLNISIPGILPGATYTPGSLALLSLCMVFAALALSYNLLLGTSGMLSFGHALYFGVGAYGLGLALKFFGVPLWPGALIALVGGLVIAAFTGAISMRVSGIPFAMVTLAFAQAGSVLVRRNQDITGGEEGLRLPVDQVPSWLVGVSNTRNLYWLTLVVLVVVYLVVLWVDRSRLGHLAQAARENELRVQVLGLRPYTAKLLVFVLAALCASLAGIAYMLLQSGTQPSTVGADLTITVLVMVVLGGVGFRWGAIVGGVLYTILDQRLTVLARSPWIQDLPDALRIPLSEPLFLLGVLFILVVMFLPGGIAGTIDTAVRRRRGERTRSQLRQIDDADETTGGARGVDAEVRA